MACKFTLISAPAGSGKTTLLSQFVARLQQPVAWLSLDEADDDPSRFWAYLIAACQSVRDGLGKSALALLDTPQPLPADTIPTLLINDIVSQDHTVVPPLRCGLLPRAAAGVPAVPPVLLSLPLNPG